jgi:hypothetical protein
MTLAQIAPLPIHAPSSEQDLEALTIAVGVTVLSLLALLGAGATFLGHYRRSRAAALRARVAEAIAADVDGARVDIVTMGESSDTSPASVTLEGVVASPAVRDRVLRLAETAARRVEPRVAVIDHLTVEPRRAA